MAGLNGDTDCELMDISEEQLLQLPQLSTSSDSGAGSTTGNKDVQSDLKVLAQTHSTIRSHLEASKIELAEKEAELKHETERTRKIGAQVCIAEQYLRTLNETLYKLKEDCTKDEHSYDVLIHEKTNVAFEIEQIQNEIRKKLDTLCSMRKKHDDYKGNVSTQDVSAEELDPEYMKLKAEVKALLEIKQKLDSGDPEVTSVRTGRALQIIDAQKDAILNGISDRELEVDLVESELDDVKEALRKAEQAVHIAENQNRARIRKKQRYLEELESTINGLKTTALHLEKKLK